jgi:hypothetical protein
VSGGSPSAIIPFWPRTSNSGFCAAASQSCAPNHDEAYDEMSRTMVLWRAERLLVDIYEREHQCGPETPKL